MNNFDWTQLVNPEFYILMDVGGVKIGLLVILFIIFAETGLFAGFFLPGDSLLFLAGIYSELLMRQVSMGSDFADVVLLSSLVSVAGVLGNMVGYWFGVKGGTYLYNKEDTFWFKEKYLLQSRDFFDKYGGKAIIFARFLPIFRTFAPIVAGIAAMDKKKFMFFNVVSSILWSFSMILAGHYLSSLFLDKFGIDLKKHIEYIVIIIVLITTIPVLFKLLKKRVHL
ncbi:membrane-associated protein [Flavobacterium fluvii]|uniref:Membrane-associated protein n=1 Tax=Flavobacterium fluvii TaxID=468056 RepID=A0A1M5G9I8_9FLAO|nr:DedA family protein [Flavobacterium fluvii]SHG00121.1 membrane-associated protein [Flavobacterium fluvii]